MRKVLTAARLWDGSTAIDDPVVVIEDGRIVSISAAGPAGPGGPGELGESGKPGESPRASPGPRVDTLRFEGALLAPAYFDVHIHGAAGHDVMEATPEALNAVGSFLASHGTGAYLATTVTAPVDATLRALDGLAKLIDYPEQIAAAGRNGDPIARPLGIHLEGPFLSHAKCGVQPREYLLEPDLGLFDRFVEAAGGHARLMTLAPELPGAAELARHAMTRGVRVSVGHSDATAEETRATIAAGAVSATHTFNAMRALDHHEPGILGVVLSEDALYAELICDGIHSKPEMAKLFWRAKGKDRAILVTDAMSAAGMPDGEYKLGGFAVQVANGKATARGVLAGSVLTLDRALENLIAFAEAPLECALCALTANPAAMTGLQDRVGRLAVGEPANLVAVDAKGTLVASIVGGERAPLLGPRGD
jgi:N-acetylglucosamine-6-phosphate deacetylase